MAGRIGRWRRTVRVRDAKRLPERGQPILASGRRPMEHHGSRIGHAAHSRWKHSHWKHSRWKHSHWNRRRVNRRRVGAGQGCNTGVAGGRSSARWHPGDERGSQNGSAQPRGCAQPRGGTRASGAGTSWMESLQRARLEAPLGVGRRRSLTHTDSVCDARQPARPPHTRSWRATVIGTIGPSQENAS